MRTGVALGSNLGDRLAHMRAGRDLLRSLDEEPSLFGVSRVYETDPVGCAPGTEPFLNAVVEIGTGLAPSALLAELRALERRLGRADARGRNLPRALDLDIIYMGGLRIARRPVIIPHPRAHERRFVLQPLADIRPALVLPGSDATVEQLLARLPTAPSVRLFAREW